MSRVRVEFQDLSDYPENVVFADDAPVVEEDTIECDDMAEAFDYTVEFGGDRQVRFVPID